MAVWSVLKVSALEGRRRLDAEYYRPEYSKLIRLLSKYPPLSQYIEKIIHPVEIKRVYEDQGLQVLLAQNIRHNFFDFSVTVFMPESVRGLISRNKLAPNDVVMTRSGANYGDVAPYFGDPVNLYACADDLVIRPKTDLPAGYLATFFNTDAGRALIKRGGYGAGQPHVAPPYLKTLRVPRFPRAVELEVDGLVRSASDEFKRSESLYLQGERIMLEELGWDKLGVTQPKWWTIPLAQAKKARRLDGEYFQPKYQLGMSLMSKSGLRLKDVAKLAKRPFRPATGTSFRYIEISNLTADGFANGEPVVGEDAPSRAAWIVRTNDVITSTVRPIRRLSAIIEPEQDGFVCSSGFAVLEPRAVEPEVLLVYLRLPIVCEILDLYTKASMYPAISATDLRDIPVTLPPEKACRQIVDKVVAARQAHQKANALLEKAKAKVDVLIGGS